MTQTVESITARINLLEQRNPVENANIIRKLKRKLRKLEQEAELHGQLLPSASTSAGNDMRLFSEDLW